jgi:DNA-binding winged helix-turn-helix (wHTH) protein
MQEPAKATQLARFGAFEVNFVAGELRKHGIRLKLQEQPFQVLLLLLARPGELVTREAIQQTLWPAGTFVDFENGLNTAINRLREALGDSAENPRFIVTEPRRGYRLIAPVDGRSRLEPDSRSLLGRLLLLGSGFKWPLRAAVVGVLITLLATASITIVFSLFPRRRTGAHASATWVQITNFADSAVSPALSSDGRMITFIRGPETFVTPGEIYVKRFDSL